MTEVQKNWHRHKITMANINKSKKYKDVKAKVALKKRIKGLKK